MREKTFSKTPTAHDLRAAAPCHYVTRGQSTGGQYYLTFIAGGRSVERWAFSEQSVQRRAANRLKKMCIEVR